MYFSERRNHILGPPIIGTEVLWCSLRQKETWYHLFALYGNLFSKEVSCEDEFTLAVIQLKQSKLLSKLRQNLLMPQIYSGQPLITLSEHSFTLYLTYLTLYLLRWYLLIQICDLLFTSKDRFGDL